MCLRVEECRVGGKGEGGLGKGEGMGSGPGWLNHSWGEVMVMVGL